jgi:glycosyltransferase involved in cell wall biosynthesis
MKIMVGAPVRNRGWILPQHIEAIQKQDVDIETCYILNDSTDDTEEVLKRYGCHYVTCNLEEMKTANHLRGAYSFTNLALLRNRLLDEFLKSDCDYLFSCDTDIIIPEGSLRQLVEDDKDIVSMLICNAVNALAFNFMMKNPEPHDDPAYDFYHPFKVPKIGLNKVDLTGAVYLIKRKVITAGVHYGHHPQGEDIYFCKLASDLGFEMYCDTRLKPIHAFEKDKFLVAETE